jgi:hypothetical protein
VLLGQGWTDAQRVQVRDLTAKLGSFTPSRGAQLKFNAVTGLPAKPATSAHKLG